MLPQKKVKMLAGGAAVAGALLVLTLLAALPQAALAAAAASTPAADSSCDGRTYTVKRGETLQDIGRALRVDWRDIAAYNLIHRPYRLTTGQKLCIPAGVLDWLSLHGSGKITSNTSVKIAGRNILVTASGYARDVTLMVKIRETGGGWNALEQILVLKDISQTISVSLPSDYQDVSPLEICLKSMYSNELTCFSVENR